MSCIHGYKTNKNNVMISKVELGLGPGVGSSPFVKLEEAVHFTQVRNVVSDRIWVRLSRSVQLVSEERISSSLPFNIIDVYTLQHRPLGSYEKYVYTKHVNN